MATHCHPRRFQKRVSLFVAALLVLLAAFTPPGSLLAAAQGRVVAIGDVHGDYDAFVAILRQAGLLDARLRWSGGNATLVQTGDFLDRGPKPREVMDLLISLEKQAAKKGGRLVVLLGNHEMMNLIGDLRYLTPENYAAFADKNSLKRQADAYQAFVALQNSRALALNQPPPVSTPEVEKAWMGTHPPGFVEHRRTFLQEGKYGRWLREKQAIAQVGGTIFLHGGLHPALASWKIDALNKRVQDEIRSFDAARQHLVARNLVLPFFTIDELTAAAQAELDLRKAEAAQHAAAATAAGTKPPEPTEAEARHLAILEQLLGLPSWLSIHPDGPLWFRGYASWADEEGAPKVSDLLAATGATSFVVGHTVQREARIVPRFGGKVFLIDTGMLSAYFKGGRPSALEIQNGKFTAIYLDQRIVLLDPAALALLAPSAVEGSGVEAAPRAVSSREEKPPLAPELLVGGPMYLPGASAPEVKAEQGFASAQQPAAQSPPPQSKPPAAEPAGQGNPPAATTAKAPPHVWLGPDGNPLPLQSDEEIMEFLRTAKLVSMREIGQGITRPRKVLLEKGGIRMNAVFHDINEEKDVAQMATGQRELFFRDTYIFQCAAYELARMLGLDNVPPVVERKLRGELGSLQIWVERTMRETDRQKRKIPPPDVVYWNRQIQLMRIFDRLIYNTDRNMGNILIDESWKVWMIDHTRAFRRHAELQEPGVILQCERGFWEKLKSLNEAEARQRLKKYLRSTEIEAIFKRRQKIVDHIQKLINEKGESRVLFSF